MTALLPAVRTSHVDSLHDLHHGSTPLQRTATLPACAGRKAVRFVRNTSSLLRCSKKPKPLPVRYTQQRETALTQWRAEISRLRILVERAHDFTPAAFVKRIHELLPELHQAAMAAVVYTYVTSGRKEELT